ncbi:MAG: DUF1517 domain-containing protein [Acidobacteriota bacterium]
MTRRSWLKKFLGASEEGVYFLGIQLIIRAFGEDTLRARLAHVIADPEGAMEDVEAKRRYIKRIVALLLEQEPYWSQAFWDYKTDPEESQAEFDSWEAELSASTATEEEEMGDEIDRAHRLSHNKDFICVTMIFNLSVPFSPAGEFNSELEYWRRETLSKLVRGLLLINPEDILADGVFVIPGNSEDGLSEEDLLTGGWSHLRYLT